MSTLEVLKPPIGRSSSLRLFFHVVLSIIMRIGCRVAPYVGIKQGIIFLTYLCKIFWSCLQDCMALLAFEEPENSPLFHYLTNDYRQSVADALNCAVLGMLQVNLIKVCQWQCRRISLLLHVYLWQYSFLRLSIFNRFLLSFKSLRLGCSFLWVSQRKQWSDFFKRISIFCTDATAYSSVLFCQITFITPSMK